MKLKEKVRWLLVIPFLAIIYLFFTEGSLILKVVAVLSIVYITIALAKKYDLLQELMEIIMAGLLGWYAIYKTLIAGILFFAYTLYLIIGFMDNHIEDEE